MRLTAYECLRVFAGSGASHIIGMAMAVAKNRRNDPLAEHKLLIIQQQELAAELFRKGRKREAREARWKLYQLLNQVEVLQTKSDEESITGSMKMRSRT